MYGLIKIRKNNNLSQTKMANMLGISIQRYNSYEKKKRRLPIDIAKTISLQFNVSLDEIFTDYENEAK